MRGNENEDSTLDDAADDAGRMDILVLFQTKLDEMHVSAVQGL